MSDDPHLYGSDDNANDNDNDNDNDRYDSSQSQSLDDEQESRILSPFLPLPSEPEYEYSHQYQSRFTPPSFLLPAPRRLYPEENHTAHVLNNHNNNHNNNHGRNSTADGTRRRTRTSEHTTRPPEFGRSLDMDDNNNNNDQETAVGRIRRSGTRKLYTPHRLLFVLFMFATYTTFWLPFPSAPPTLQATYSLRGSRISLDTIDTSTLYRGGAVVSMKPTTTVSTSTTSNRPLPTLDERGRRPTAVPHSYNRGSSTGNTGSGTAVGNTGTVGPNLALARPSGTTSLAYRNLEMKRYYQQEAFHQEETDAFFRWICWYCNVVVLSMFVVAAAREYKNRGQGVCEM
jgi:hypothetical protein